MVTQLLFFWCVLPMPAMLKGFLPALWVLQAATVSPEDLEAQPRSVFLESLSSWNASQGGG